MKRLRLVTLSHQASCRPRYLRSIPHALFSHRQKMSSPAFHTGSPPPQPHAKKDDQTPTFSYKLSHSPLSLPSTPSPSYDPSVPIFDRCGGAWAKDICSHGGGEYSYYPSSKNERVFISFIAFRCTSPLITSQAWVIFTEKFEKLMLMRWELEASEGADPDDCRRYFKMVWVEDIGGLQVPVDLGFLRR
jgi:hypothetical protein